MWDVPEEVGAQLEFEYTDETCPVCNNRIDGKGLCTCGSGSD
jgi:hypothetical protein